MIAEFFENVNPIWFLVGVLIGLIIAFLWR